MTGVSGVLGAVLAGGASRRFGRDKAAASVGGIPMIQRAVEALSPLCDEVVVVSSRDDTPVGPWRVIPDLRGPMGPLGGLETALTWARDRASDSVFVLACDLPLVDESLVRAVIAAPDDAPAHAPRRDGDPDFEPLCALYKTSCLSTATRLLDGGERAARSLFEAVGGSRVEVGHVSSEQDAGASALLNVNTEDDLDEAEAAQR